MNITYKSQKLDQAIEPPLISIVVPSYNQGNFIEKTILSVINQTYKNKEIIVIDGGSSDQTLSIIKKYSTHFKYWTTESDNGQAHAINKGMAHACGKYYYWINSDDIIYPNSLEISINELEKSKNPLKISYGKRHRINENGEIFDFDLPPQKLSLSRFLLGSWIPQETAIFSQSLWKKLDGLNENFQFALDYDLVVRAFLAKASFTFVNRFLGAMRFHNKCKSCDLKLVETQIKECKLIREKIIQGSISMKIWQKLLCIIIGPAIYKFNYLRKKNMHIRREDYC